METLDDGNGDQRDSKKEDEEDKESKEEEEGYDIRGGKFEFRYK